MNNGIRYALAGLLIGASNIIPGVSGGTMAVVMGVFDAIIAAIAHIKDDFMGSLRVLIPTGIGGLIGIFLFSRVITYCYANFPTQTGFTFMGLIIGTLPAVFRLTARKGETRRFGFYAPCAIAMLAVVAFSLMIAPSGAQAGEGIMWTLWLFVVGVIAAMGMIIPGLSGSFILLLLGVYQPILAAVSSVDLPTLIPVGLGCIVGIFGGAVVINALLKAAPRVTYSAILGLMLGSLLVVFPGFSFNLTGATSLLAAYVAAFIANFFMAQE